jgi:hypothetical protein
LLGIEALSPGSGEESSLSYPSMEFLGALLAE